MTARGKQTALMPGNEDKVGKLLAAGAEIRVPPSFKWLDPSGRPQVSGRPALIFILRPKP